MWFVLHKSFPTPEDGKIALALRVEAENALLCVTPRALIGTFSVTTEAAMKEQQTLKLQ